jgi:predicted Zn-dependent protease
VQFLRRLQAEQERSGREHSGLLATHPRLNDRCKKLEKVVLNLPPPAFAVRDEAEFLGMRQAVRDYDEMYARLVAATAPPKDAPHDKHSNRPPSGNRTKSKRPSRSAPPESHLTWRATRRA